MPGLPAARGWRITHCWVPPCGPPLPAPYLSRRSWGRPLPAEGERGGGGKGGGEMEVSFGSYCSLPEKAAQSVLAAHSRLGPATGGKRVAFVMSALQSKSEGMHCSTRSNASCCLRLPLKFNSFTLCYRSFIFLMMCAALAIPPAALTPTREQASTSSVFSYKGYFSVELGAEARPSRSWSGECVCCCIYHTEL